MPTWELVAEQLGYSGYSRPSKRAPIAGAAGSPWPAAPAPAGSGRPGRCHLRLPIRYSAVSAFPDLRRQPRKADRTRH
jgi:hypothetical protein